MRAMHGDATAVQSGTDDIEMPILLMIFNTPAFNAFRAFSIPTFDSTAALAFLPSAGGVVNCVATRNSMYGWTAGAP